MAKRKRSTGGQFVKSSKIKDADAVAAASVVVDSSIKPGLPKAVNAGKEDVSAIREAARKGLRRVEDWNEYEKQQQLLHPMLPDMIQERRMKYILIGRDNYNTYPLKDAVTPVTRDNACFDILPDEVFSEGVYSAGDSVVCAMDMADYEAHRHFQKSRMRARINSLRSKEEQEKELAQSGQEVAGTLVTGLRSTDDIMKDPDREALVSDAKSNL